MNKTLQRTAKLIAWYEQAALAGAAHQADVSTGAHDVPFPSTTGMLLAQAYNVADVDGDEGHWTFAKSGIFEIIANPVGQGEYGAEACDLVTRSSNKEFSLSKKYFALFLKID